MFETYNAKQESTSNHCGGFALAAIINDITAVKKDGKEIYYSLISFQSSPAIRDSFPVFHKDNAAGALTLPSSLIKFTHQLWPEAQKKITISNMFFQANKKLCAFEMESIAPLAEIKIKANESLQDHIDKKGYYLVVVHEGCHWIAMGRNSDGLFMYDPATGKNGKILSTEKDAFSLGDDNYFFSGVIIRL